MKRINYDKVFVVDLEATCWETKEESAKNTSEIIEIGIVLLNLKTQQIEKSEGIIIKPDFSTVSEFCTKLTTLTQEDVNKGISFVDAYDKLLDEFHTEDYPWASYGAYDRKMLDRQCKRYSCQSPMSDEHMNVKTMAALVSKDKRAVGMEKTLQNMNIPLVGTHHRGIDDALNITKILQRILFK